jgi:hypothetical protein
MLDSTGTKQLIKSIYELHVQVKRSVHVKVILRLIIEMGGGGIWVKVISGECYKLNGLSISNGSEADICGSCVNPRLNLGLEPPPPKRERRADSMEEPVAAAADPPVLVLPDGCNVCAIDCMIEAYVAVCPRETACSIAWIKANVRAPVLAVLESALVSAEV